MLLCDENFMLVECEYFALNCVNYDGVYERQRPASVRIGWDKKGGTNHFRGQKGGTGGIVPP